MPEGLSLQRDDLAGVQSYDDVGHRFTFDGAPQMRCACRNDDHVSRLDPTANASVDGISTDTGAVYSRDDYARACTSLWIDMCAPCHQYPGTFNHVINLGHFVVRSAAPRRSRTDPINHTDSDIVPSGVDHANRSIIDRFSVCDFLIHDCVNLFGGDVSSRTGRFCRCSSLGTDYT